MHIQLVRNSSDVPAVRSIVQRAGRIHVQNADAQGNGLLGLWAQSLCVSISPDRIDFADPTSDARATEAPLWLKLQPPVDTASADQHSEGYGSNAYARLLAKGMTRALALGRGTTSVHLVSPRHGSPLYTASTLENPVYAEQYVTVDIRVQDFMLGRDGSACANIKGTVITCNY